MRTAIRKMGNSSGIIIPKAILNALDVTTGDAVELRAEDGRVIIDPIRSHHPRAGWAEAAKALGQDPAEDASWTDMANIADADWMW